MLKVFIFKLMGRWLKLGHMYVGREGRGGCRRDWGWREGWLNFMEMDMERGMVCCIWDGWFEIWEKLIMIGYYE